MNTSSSSPSSPAVVGLDIGHSAVKMTYETASGEIARAIYPSLACPAITISNPLEAARARQETVDVDGVPYFVGDTARIQGQSHLPVGLNDHWIASHEHTALLLQAIRLVNQSAQEDGAERRPYLWIMGLPVIQYALDKDRLASMVERYLPEGDRIKVIQQPDAVYFCHIYNREGMPKPGLNPENEAWAVIDIGYFTTDFILYERGRYVEAAAGRQDGMRGVVEHVQRELTRMGMVRSMVEIEAALALSRIRHQGKMVDISEQVKRAVHYFASKIVDEAGRLFGRRIHSLDGILVAGGGASLVVDALKSVWPHVHMVQDEYHPDSATGSSLHGPRFAISEGYWRFGRSVLLLEQYVRANGGSL